MCTNKFWAFFLLILKIYSEKLVQCMLFKILPISFYYRWPSFRQHTDTAFKKFLIFWGDPRIDPIFVFFIRSEVLLSQAMSHRPKQVVVRRSNVWRIRRVGQGIPVKCFQSFLDDFSNVWPRVVVLKDHFVMSFGILGAFKLQCSAQWHQLLSVTFRSDGFVRLE